MRRSLSIFLLAGALFAAENPVDLSIVHRIKAEAFEHSKVMDHLFYLADRYGPRLTASPNYHAAAEWAAARLREYGLDNARLEKWGPFGRSWSYAEFHAAIVEPQYSPLLAFPLAWSAATGGPVTGEAMLAVFQGGRDPEKYKEELQKFRTKYKGQLKGKILLLNKPSDPELQTKAASTRFSDRDLANEFLAPFPQPVRAFDYSKLAVPEDQRERQQFFMKAPPDFRERYREAMDAATAEFQSFLRDEGVLAVFSSDRRGDGGTVFGEAAGPYKARYPQPLTAIRLTPEHYNRVARLLEKKVPVRIRVELQAQASDRDVEAENVIAEIPGSTRPEEVVMVGAHLDSWIGGTGATDNGDGSAVAIEVMRVLKALGLKMDRTVRIGLWGGEEQGLLGSKAYVERHLGDPKTMQLKPEQPKISGYFNLDNGSGRIRGVYLQGNDAARPLFEAWLAPFRDLGVSTITIRDTGGTDHLSFDAVGIPGFQFIQDPLEYGTRTHHSNMDVYDHTQPGDLMQAAAVMASVVYHAATRPEMMPRKPLPQPAKP